MNPLGETAISNNITDKTDFLHTNTYDDIITKHTEIKTKDNKSHFLKTVENPLMGEQTENNKNDPNISDFSQELGMSQYHRENEEIHLAFSNADALKESDVSFRYNNDTYNISNNPISAFWRPF